MKVQTLQKTLLITVGRVFLGLGLKNHTIKQHQTDGLRIFR